MNLQLFEALIDFGDNWDDHSLALLAGGNLLRVFRQVHLHVLADNAQNHDVDDDVVVNCENENRLRHRRNTEVVLVTILGWRVDSKAPVDPDFSIYRICYAFHKLGPVKKNFPVVNLLWPLTTLPVETSHNMTE